MEANEAPQFEEDFYKQVAITEVSVADAQANVMTNGIEPAVEEPAMDQRQDSVSPGVQDVDPDTVSPSESPIPETEVSFSF